MKHKVPSSILQNDTVSSSILQNDTVSPSTIQNDTVSASILQNNMVSSSIFQNDTVSSSTLQNNLVHNDAPSCSSSYDDPCCSSSYDAPSCSSSLQYNSSNLSLFLNPAENFSLLDYINNDNNEPLETIMDSTDFEYLKDFQSELLDLNQYLSNSPSDNPQLSDLPSENPQLSNSPSENPQLSNSPSENPELSDIPSKNPEISNPPSENPQISDPPSENTELSDTDELKIALEFMFILNNLFRLEIARWKRKHDSVCWDSAYTIRSLENKIKDLDHRCNVTFKKLRKTKTKLHLNSKRQNEKISNMMNEPTPKRVKRIKKCTMCD